MKKLLLSTFSFLLLISCSVDENENLLEDTNLEAVVENYKGIFTTVNGDNRGILDVSISSDSRSAIATLSLVNGDIVTVFTEQIEDINSKKEIKFTSNDLSFVMITGQEGETITIDNVSFRGSESSMLAAKNSEKAPVTPITGTYLCTTCGGAVDNSTTQTFNFMFLSDASGDSNIATQTTLGMTVFNGIGIQNNCTADGTETTCDNTSGDGMSNVGYTAGSGDVTWSGTHTFNNEASGPNDCSGVSGTWSWDSSTVGLVSGTYVSDTACVGPLVTLYSEDFQSFTGSGFAPMPAAGQLDSDVIIANGLSAGSLAYGETQTEGDFARGSSNGSVSSGGVYAFDVDGAGDVALGVQPTGSDFTPGEFDFRIQNTTGAALSSFVINYDLHVNNDQTRSNTFNFAYSTDNITFTPVTALNYVSPEPSDELGFITINQSESFNAAVAADAFIYLRFESNDNSGGGSRDEFAINNILLQGN